MMLKELWHFHQTEKQQFHLMDLDYMLNRTEATKKFKMKDVRKMGIEFEHEIGLNWFNL